MTPLKSQKIAGSIDFQFKKYQDGKVVDQIEVAATLNREDNDKENITEETIGVILDPIATPTGEAGCPRITYNHEVNYASI